MEKNASVRIYDNISCFVYGNTAAQVIFCLQGDTYYVHTYLIKNTTGADQMQPADYFFLLLNLQLNPIQKHFPRHNTLKL